MKTRDNWNHFVSRYSYTFAVIVGIIDSWIWWLLLYTPKGYHPPIPYPTGNSTLVQELTPDLFFSFPILAFLRLFFTLIPIFILRKIENKKNRSINFMRNAKLYWQIIPFLFFIEFVLNTVLWIGIQIISLLTLPYAWKAFTGMVKTLIFFLSNSTISI